MSEGRRSGVEMQHLYHRNKLNDEDHRIHAIAQLGGVVRVLDEKRGVLAESFRTMDGEDCTQSITKLERAGLVNTITLQREIVGQMFSKIRSNDSMKNLVQQLSRLTKRKKP